MSYPYDGDPKRTRVLEAMRTTLEGIRSGAGYHHTVKQVLIYDGAQLVLGASMPAIVIVPESSDRSVGQLTCAAVRHAWELSLVLSIRVVPGARADQWRREIEWLCSDVTVALENDPQLGGEVVYADITESDVFDLSAGSEIAQAQIVVAVEYRHALTNPTA